jgi:hypothetical protein
MQRMPQTASSVDSSGSDSVFLRTGAWGMAAVLALGTFIYAAQTDTGAARMQVALSEALGADAPAVIARTPTAPPAAQTGPALAALEAKLERLSADRARLETRLATLEHGLDDVTGSIRREKAEPKPAPAPFIEPPVIPPISTLPPATTVAAIPAESAAEPVPPADAAPRDMPIPQVRPAARPASHVEYGVELGTAADMDALRARWTGVKANFGPLLVGLSPVAVKDKRPGSTQLRLMAGPLKSMAAARELCAKFVAANGYCWPTRVDTADVVQR